MFTKITRRLSVVVAPWLLAGTLLAENPEVEEYDDDDSPPEEPCCPNTCSPSDGGGASGGGCAPCEETGSIFFSVSLGRTSFFRQTNFVRAAALPTYYARPSYKAFATAGMAHKTRSPYQIQSYYLQSPKTGKKSFRLWIAQENVDASSYLASSLLVDEDTIAEKIRDGGGVIRQILTDDRLADIQPLATVRTSLPSEIQGALPTNSEGFVVRTWFAHQAGTKVGSLYPLPGTDSVEYMVFYNPDAPTDSGRLNVIMKSLYAGTSYKTRSYAYHQDTSSHDWTSKQYAGLPTDTLVKETTLDVTSWTSARDYTQTRTVKEKAITPSGTWGTLQTVAAARENFDDISGTSRMVEEIKGYGSSEPRTTKYGYYDTPTASSTHARLKWKSNPDASFEHYTYTFDFTSGSATIVKRMPWKDYKWDPAASPGGPSSANCVNETTYSTTTATTVTTQVGSTTVGYKTESWADVSATSVHTEREYYNATQYLTTSTGYHPSTEAAHLAGKVKWKELTDGTAETYSYTTPDTNKNYVETVDIGAGDRNGITKGIRIVSMRNKFGFTYNWKRSYFDNTGVYDLETWDGSTSVDNFGRPTIRTWNANAADFDQTTFGCCGIASFRDRKGVVTDYFRDDLMRVRKVIETAGSRVVTTTTDFNGLVTEKRKSGGTPLVDVLVSKVWNKLNGETEKIWEPDQDGDSVAEETTYGYVYPGTGGTIITQTNPDGGTKIEERYVDGNIKSISGTGVADKVYDYGVHATGGGGVWASTTQPTAASPTGEWVKTYEDRLGRIFKTEYPTQLRTSGTNDHILVTFYTAVAGAGSRGRVYQKTDSDGMVVTYTYDGEGKVSSIIEPMPGTVGNKVTSASYDAVNDGTFGNSLRETTQVNGVTVSTKVSGGTGYDVRHVSFGSVTSVSRTVGAGGDWVETTTNPDNTKTIWTHDDNLLQSVVLKDSTTPGNTIESESYAYDGAGRLATSSHSRTGATAYNSYTPSGKLLSKTEPGNRTITYKYDRMGRRTEVDAPTTLDASGGSVANVAKSSYYPTGRKESEWGDQGYPVNYVYDEQDRILEMRTFRSLSHGTKPTSATSGADLTTWSYHSNRGWLTAKRDNSNKGVDYTHTAAGELKTRTWERGVHTRYDYSNGQLSAVSYFTSAASDTGSNPGNDAATPDLGYTYDSFGRVTQVSRGGASHFTYTYDSDELYLATEFQNDAPYENRLLTRKRDGLLRPAGYLLGSAADPDKISEVTYGYDTAGRFSTLSYQRVPGAATPPSAKNFTYGYESNSRGLVETVTGPAHTIANSWDPERDLLVFKENLWGAAPMSTHYYTLNDLGQRTEVEMNGAATGLLTWEWGYDAKGQVVKGNASSGSGGTAHDRFYDYDSIGNRKQSRTGTFTSTGGTATNYFADAGATMAGGNGLNQYGAMVTGSTTRQPVHDDDGNLLDNGAGWSYTWDGENRMSTATPSTSSGLKKVGYHYDHVGRLFLRQLYAWNGSAWAFYESYRYVYDGWNRIESYLSWTGLQDEYVWGLDLSGTTEGAGGVGGMLLWSTSYDSGANWNVYYPAYDGNGNVTELLAPGGTVAAHWEYDPFGNTLVSSYDQATDPWSDPGNLFEFRFSTKPQDRNTGLYYYGYRFYDTVTGRWASRDPIEEEGGFNLYEFGPNSPMNGCDILGKNWFMDRLNDLMTALGAADPGATSSVQTVVSATAMGALAATCIGAKQARDRCAGDPDCSSERLDELEKHVSDMCEKCKDAGNALLGGE